jgi:uncharacterized protein (UPF0332 family)
MKPGTARLLDKAARALASARELQRVEDAEGAASRAYYAMFHAAVALCHENGLVFGKHSAVHAAFGKHFARTGSLDIKYHRWLLDAFDRRGLADYSIDESIPAAEVDATIGRAADFIDAVKRHLANS